MDTNAPDMDAAVRAGLRLAGQAGFKGARLAGLSYAHSAALLGRLATARRAAQLSPRAFARLGSAALLAFGESFGFSRAELRFAQACVAHAWAAHRVVVLSRRLARQLERRSLQ